MFCFLLSTMYWWVKVVRIKRSKYTDNKWCPSLRSETLQNSSGICDKNIKLTIKIVKNIICIIVHSESCWVTYAFSESSSGRAVEPDVKKEVYETCFCLKQGVNVVVLLVDTVTLCWYRCSAKAVNGCRRRLPRPSRKCSPSATERRTNLLRTEFQAQEHTADRIRGWSTVPR